MNAGQHSVLLFIYQKWNLKPSKWIWLLVVHMRLFCVRVYACANDAYLCTHDLDAFHFPWNDVHFPDE